MEQGVPFYHLFNQSAVDHCRTVWSGGIIAPKVFSFIRAEMIKQRLKKMLLIDHAMKIPFRYNI